MSKRGVRLAWRTTQRPSVPASGHRRASQRPGALTLGVRASRPWRAERLSVLASERVQSYCGVVAACGPGRASQRRALLAAACRGASQRPASGGLSVPASRPLEIRPGTRLSAPAVHLNSPPRTDIRYPRLGGVPGGPDKVTTYPPYSLVARTVRNAWSPGRCLDIRYPARF